MMPNVPTRAVEGKAAAGGLRRLSNPTANGPLRTKFTSLAALSALDRARWHVLALQRPTSGPLVDTAWMGSWLRAFEPLSPVLVGAWEGENLVGLAALQSLPETCWGRRVHVLRSLTNDESYRFDFLSSEGRVDVEKELWRALCDATRCDLIRLDHVPDGSPTLIAGLDVAHELGWQPVLRPTFFTPWRRLSRDAPWDDGLKRKFRSNLRNRERRLAALGDVCFQVVTADEGLQQGLELFYALERGGWKGERGTAVAQQRPVKRFYDELVGRASGDIWIPVLTVDGTPIAAQVLRVWGRTMFMLKTAYDQRYSEYAPGQLLTARVIRHGIEHGVEALDFLAANASWKADWTSLRRPHYSLLLFAPSPQGRHAYWLRYGIPAQVKKLPGLVPLALWLQGKRP